MNIVNILIGNPLSERVSYHGTDLPAFSIVSDQVENPVA